MAAISLRGYWRTLIVFIACNPAMRMTKLTTIASTGRLMNRSVKDFILNVRHSGAERSAFKVPLRDPSTFARDDVLQLRPCEFIITNRPALDLPGAWVRDRC